MMNTRVIIIFQVTCEIVEPRPSRPNEGKLSIGVHLSPMAASHFEQGRGNELIDELQQILDRNIKESRCVDVESLCIMSEESVWQLKVDVTVSFELTWCRGIYLQYYEVIKDFYYSQLLECNLEKQITLGNKDLLQKMFLGDFLVNFKSAISIYCV